MSKERLRELVLDIASIPPARSSDGGILCVVCGGSDEDGLFEHKPNCAVKRAKAALQEERP